VAAVVRDPLEGVTAAGTIVTGADEARVPPAYTTLLREAVQTLGRALGDAAHSIYLYGSVATGQARPPRSDLDLIVVLDELLPDAVRRIADDLSARNRHLVREVGIGSVDLETLGRQDLVGDAERCFLKHYTVHLAGPDLRDAYPLCEPTARLAAGFNGDLRAVLDDVRLRLTQERDVQERDALARKACRRILMAAATLLSVRAGGWSTDRGTAVELIGRHAPQLEALAADALTWSEQGAPADPAAVTDLIDRLGGWLAEEYALIAT
jgi:uncharacterized protein